MVSLSIRRSRPRITPRTLRKLEELGVKRRLADNEELVGRFLAHDIVDLSTGAIFAEAGAEEFCMFDGGTRSPAALPGVDGIPAVQGAGVSEGSGALEGAGAGRAADADTPGYGDVLLGLAPPVPDWRRLAALDRVLRQLGECGGGEARAAALTARGWIEWCRGRGSYADALYTAAAMEQPGYRLAELLAELGRRGTLCGWARRKEAAWQKFDPDAA